MFMSRLFSRGIQTAALLALVSLGCGGKKDEPVASNPAPTQAPPSEPAFFVVGKSIGVTVGRTPDPSETKKDTGKPKLDIANAKPDFVMTAGAWAKEWKAGEEAATKKYDGKIIELKGTVDHFNYNPDRDDIGTFFLTLKNNDHYCISKDKEPWAFISPGSAVKVRGLRPSYGRPGDLYECTIVEKGPNPAITISAQQLAKEFKANKDKALAKYEKKSLILDGVAEGPGNREGLFLKGDGGVRIQCLIGAGLGKTFGAVKQGEAIKVFGEFYGLEADAVQLIGTMPITGSK